MATEKENTRITELQKEFSDLKTNVALLQQFNQKVVDPALKEIKDTLKGFSFVTTKEFELYKEEVDERLGKKSLKENIIAGAFSSVITAFIMFVFYNLVGGK